MDHIQSAVLQHPELADRYAKLGQLYDRTFFCQRWKLTSSLPDLHQGGGGAQPGLVQGSELASVRKGSSKEEGRKQGRKGEGRGGGSVRACPGLGRGGEFQGRRRLTGRWAIPRKPRYETSRLLGKIEQANDESKMIHF